MKGVVSQRQAGGKGGELKYVYYPSGGGNRIQWQYDDYHRPGQLWRRIGGNEVRVGQWTWYNDGSVNRFRRGNGLDTFHYYDTAGRLNQAQTKNSAGTTIFNLRYEYDKEGNRLTQRITTGETYWDERYYYDTLYRLAEMKRGHVWWDGNDWVVSNVQRTEDWNLDLLGNWSEYDVTGDESVSEDRTHNVLNQITAINQTGLTYDLHGNLTDDGAKKYVWDIAGRLKEVRDSQDTLIASFKYDPFGRRTTKYIPDTNNTYTYYYDGWRVLEEHNNGAFASRNVWGLYLDELVVRTNPMGTDLYPVSNPIYSPLRYYGGDGALEMRIQYTPYGRASLVKANGIPVVPDEASYPILFTGQRYDCETSLHYYKKRYYTGAQGRFLSRDPWGYRDNINIYSYAWSAPTAVIDELGGLGTFVITFMKLRGANIQFDIRFYSDDPCCTKFKLTQIVKSTTLWEGKWHKDKMEDLVAPGGTTPGGKTVEVKGGKHRGKRVTGYQDVPGKTIAVFLKQEFETCADCIEGSNTGKRYGCVRFGWTWWWPGNYQVRVGGDVTENVKVKEVEQVTEPPTKTFEELVGTLDTAYCSGHPRAGDSK